ncbi:DoxX family membrane protein [Corynebacterium sp. TAE3-ERU2]|uniref:DoxX family membrane protein n=1 Tax=Corynebacterium sp. TAE3-ERU2 TaxID=2849497 RepID=UPI001C468443|nr:DoxX family membrane protein [Corynebacterium sp. TAE3-ERU2]MBV7301108.1 DoxX family membrane protein [Corynebacterium sp. TAE3-ERU2]
MTKPENPRPDKARADDFGEDTEIPTYNPKDSAGSADARRDSKDAKASESQRASDKPAASEPAASARDEAHSKKQSSATTQQSSTPEPKKSGKRSTAGSIYERTGRAAPQAIPPRGQAGQPEQARAAEPAEQPAAQPANDAPERGAAPVRSSTPSREEDSNETVVMPRAGAAAAAAASAQAASDKHPERSRPLASDAPTSARDTRATEPESTPAPAAQPGSERRQPPRPEPTRPAAEETVALQRPQPAGDADYDADYAQAPGVAAASGAAAAPAAGPQWVEGDMAEPADDAEQPYDPALDHRRGTLDFGIFLLRVGVGALLILAGVKTFFQLGDSEGLSGLENEFSGYAMPWLLSVVQPSLQLLAGVFLLLGLLTPVAAAVGIVATLLSALHQIDVLNAGVNPLNWSGEVLFCVVMILAVLALQFTGPGKLSLDFNRSWAHRPLLSSWLWVLVGGAAAVALWWFGAGVNPLN